MIRVNRRPALLAALVALLVAGGLSAQAPVKLTVAVIDVQRILAESEEGKKEMARIKKLQDDRVQQLNQREAEVQKLKDKLTDLGFSIAEEERTKLQRSIEDRMIEGDRFRKDADREIKSQFEDVFASFEKRIYPVIEQLGGERGFELIVNREAPGIVWAAQKIDITTDVIERFNKMAGTLPAPGAKPPAAKK